MAKIHELIAVEQDKVSVANSLIEEGIGTFTKKPDHFIGQTRKVTMYEEARQQENIAEIKEIVDTVDGKLDHIWEAVIPAIDATMAKENSNTSREARADVIVNGQTVLTDVPAIALLALEKKIGQLKNLYAAIPTLDPAYAWSPDPNAALAGTMKTSHPQEGYKTEKVLEHKVLYAATKEHPAQISEFTIDRNVAKVTTERQSGMVSPATKAKWARRLSDLQTAVKEARQRANGALVLPLPIAAPIRAFVHAE